MDNKVSNIRVYSYSVCLIHMQTEKLTIKPQLQMTKKKQVYHAVQTDFINKIINDCPFTPAL